MGNCVSGINSGKTDQNSKDKVVSQTILNRDIKQSNAVKEANNSPVYVVQFDFVSQPGGDFCLKTGSRVRVLNTSNNEWWEVENVENSAKGFIPGSYLALENSLESKPWFFGRINRFEAESKLNMFAARAGVFLIRNSESNQNAYALSVKEQEGVKHFRVLPNGNGQLYISDKRLFNSLDELVEHYSSKSEGLGCCLTEPCRKMVPQLTSLGKDLWEIPRDSLAMKNKVGSGQFGEVWFGIWKDTTQVAIKKLKPGSMSKEAFLQEAEIMKKFKHKNLVSLLAVCTEDEPYFIVTEFMENGSLLDFLRGAAGAKLSIVPQMTDMMAQIAAGMGYLEQHKCVHRDLAARNILVNSEMVCKVADFGLARSLEDGETKGSEDTKFPIKWTAPEAALQQKFSVKSDVWSYGILLAEMVTYGRQPYPGMPNQEVLEKIQGTYRMPKPDNCPDELYNTMLKCWQKDPAMRPTFDYLDSYFTDYTSNVERSYGEAGEDDE